LVRRILALGKGKRRRKGKITRGKNAKEVFCRNKSERGQ